MTNELKGMDCSTLNEYCQDMALLTSETAKQLQPLSVQSRLLAAREADFAKARALVDSKENPQVLRITKQLAKIEEMIEEQTEKPRPNSKEIVNLTAAHARLFSAWQVLTGTQNPGVRKVSKRRETSNVQPLPQPEVSRNTDVRSSTDTTPTTGPRSEDCNG